MGIKEWLDKIGVTGGVTGEGKGPRFSLIPGTDIPSPAPMPWTAPRAITEKKDDLIPTPVEDAQNAINEAKDTIQNRMQGLNKQEVRELFNEEIPDFDNILTSQGDMPDIEGMQEDMLDTVPDVESMQADMFETLTDTVGEMSPSDVAEDAIDMAEGSISDMSSALESGLGDISGSMSEFTGTLETMQGVQAKRFAMLTEQREQIQDKLQGQSQAINQLAHSLTGSESGSSLTMPLILGLGALVVFKS